MGMYDTIRCDYPLPGNPPAGLDWQTKSLECALDLYAITADGRLEHEAYDTVDRSDPNAAGLERFWGFATKVNQRMEPVPDYRGEVSFYDTAPDGTWWEYSALFDAGRLLSIKQLSPAG
jgi:hypothetical protein